MNSLGLLYTRIGEESLQDLSKNFYLEVSKIPELRSLYPEDLDAAERRIYLFLLQALGGPQTYSEERGHPRLRMRHMQWKIDSKMSAFVAWGDLVLQNKFEGLQVPEQETYKCVFRQLLNLSDTNF